HFEGRELGSHSRLTFERRFASHSHAAGNANRLDDGPAWFAEEADDRALVAEPKWSGNHPEGGLERKGWGRSEGAETDGGEGQIAGRAADFRHDFPPRHTRDVDALLPRRWRNQSG